MNLQKPFYVKILSKISRVLILLSKNKYMKMISKSMFQVHVIPLIMNFGLKDSYSPSLWFNDSVQYNLNITF